MTRVLVLAVCFFVFWTISPARAAGRYDAKQPRYIYARAGDPLRFVWPVGDGGSMGILAEGPLRARCFLIEPYYRDLTLDEPGRPGHPASVAALAARLDLTEAEVPADVVTLWRTGRVDWSIYEPGPRAPIAGTAPVGPYQLAGREAARLFVLGEGRGFLVVFHYMPGYSRVLRLAAPVAEFVVRPGAGLIEMIHHPHVSPSDVGRHLMEIDRGVPVDWSELRGYLD